MEQCSYKNLIVENQYDTRSLMRKLLFNNRGTQVIAKDEEEKKKIMMMRFGKGRRKVWVILCYAAKGNGGWSPWESRKKFIIHNRPKQKKTQKKNCHLIIHFPTGSGVSEWASKWTNERSGARKQSEGVGASKWSSNASKRAKRQASGPVLMPWFFVIVDHSFIDSWIHWE